MLFGEYELSPSLIGLSLLPTAHPEAFQRLSVRSSIPRYRDFNLAMGRSLGFASAASNYSPSSDSLSLRLRASLRLTSLRTATRRFIMQKARRHRTRPAPTACRRTVSGTISLPCHGCFSPFPHGTGPLSVSGECLALADGPAGFTQGSTCPALLRMPLSFMALRVRDSHPLRSNFPERSTRANLAVSRSYNPRRAGTRRVWAIPRSLATTWGITCCFLFLPVLRCFSSRGSPPYTVWVTGRQPAGLPHSEIRGSQVACTSPRLIAACRVLHRLPEPRHPPYALSYFRRACATFRRHGTCLRPAEHTRADGPALQISSTFSIDSLASSAPDAPHEMQSTQAEEPFSSVPACQRPRRDKPRAHCGE